MVSLDPIKWILSPTIIGSTVDTATLNVVTMRAVFQGPRLKFPAQRFGESKEGKFMSKLFRCMTLCTISVAFATLSIALAQTYTQIDFPGAVITTLNGGPNPEGTNIGTYTDTAAVVHGFTLQRGVFTTLDVPGASATTPNWITPQGMIVGGFLDASGASHGFIFQGGKFMTVDFPNANGTVLTSLNSAGELTGEWCVVASCASGTTHSFTRSKEGQFTSFDPPGAVSSSANTVNPSGTVVGAFVDSAGSTHGYQLDHGIFTTIDFPGSVGFTFVGANNPEGTMVGTYADSAGVFHSFQLNNGVFISFDPPGAVGFSDASGINPSGVIVGVFFDSAVLEHGYIRNP